MKRCTLHTLLLAAATAAMLLSHASLGASETDGKIDAAFAASYVNKFFFSANTIKAETTDGVVTLNGTVTDDAHKALAGNIAAGLAGVTKVDNQLVIVPEGDDTWVANKVRLTLGMHRNLNASRTVVVVKDGIVTLTGKASSQVQKDLTTEYVADVTGVKSVVNSLTVSALPADLIAAEQVDDASVTAQAKVALATHRSTSAIPVQVVTREGEVTVTGEAQTEAEKAQVTKLLQDIHGVIRINNQMTLVTARTP